MLSEYAVVAAAASIVVVVVVVFVVMVIVGQVHNLTFSQPLELSSCRVQAHSFMLYIAVIVGVAGVVGVVAVDRMPPSVLSGKRY